MNLNTRTRNHRPSITLPGALAGLCLALLLAGAGGCASSPQLAAQIMFINANVLTMADDQPQASTVVVNGDQIVAVGDETLAASYRADQVIDLAGATLLPGFIG